MKKIKTFRIEEKLEISWFYIQFFIKKDKFEIKKYWTNELLIYDKDSNI